MPESNRPQAEKRTRFPAPWQSVPQQFSYAITDANGTPVAHVFFAEASTAWPSRADAYRLANAITRLPNLLMPAKRLDPLEPLQYHVEQWTDDDLHIEFLLAASMDLQMAHAAFDHAVKARPTKRLTLRQRVRVIRQHPLKAG